MNEFEVLVTPKAGSIETNFADIKEQLELEMTAYQGMEVTEKNLAESKKDLAFLRKVYKSINDKKVDIKKQYMQPYTAFENECKGLLEVVQKPIDEIDVQIKEFDKKRIAEKREQLRKLYEENIEDKADYIPFENTLESSWSNVSYKEKDYLFKLSELKVKVANDLEAIKSLSSEIQDELFSVYAKSGNDLSKAITRNTQYLNDKAKVTQQIKEELPPFSPTECQPSEPVDVWADVDTETGEIIPTFTFKVQGNEYIEKVKEFLDFAEIEYVEV